MLLNSQNNEF